MKSGISAGRLLCLASLYALAAPAYAIDCAKAATAVEKLICSDRKTVAADAELNRAYAAILKQAPDGDIRAMLAHSQKRWIVARDGVLMNLIEDPGSVPAGKTVAGVARDLIQSRTAQLKETHKGAALPDMIGAFRALVQDSRGIVRAEVRVAERPSDALIEEIKASLKDIAKADVDIDLVVDPSLIGGLIVKMGSRMVDASLKTKLNGIRLAMRAAR